MTPEELRANCIEEGRSLQWMLAVLSQEEVLVRLSRSPLGDSAIIKGSYVIQSLCETKSTTLPSLELALCTGEALSLREELMDAGEELISLKDISLVEEESDHERKEALYVVKSIYKGIPASFYLKVIYYDTGESLGRSLFGVSSMPEKKPLPRLSGGNEPIPLLYMCPEGIFVERYLEASRRGELVDSMMTWYDMFYISTAMCLDGHRMGGILETLSREEISESLERFKGSKSLGDRWRAFAREYKVPLKGFPDLAEYLSSIMEPVTEALKRGEEFFGEWMPELCRYID